MFFISSNALSTPPKPASASATIGANQSTSVLPSDQVIWSARASALLIRRTTAGTELAGEGPWAGAAWGGRVEGGGASGGGSAARRGGQRRRPPTPTGRWP